MYFVYVLRNPEGLLYKGQTQNLEARLKEHNDPNHCHSYTKNKGPWKLVYHETHNTRSEAMRREKYLKTGAGRDFLKRVTME